MTRSYTDRRGREWGIELVFCQNGFLKPLSERRQVADPASVAARQSRWRDPGAGRCAELGAADPGRGRIPAGACGPGRQHFTCRGGKGLDLSPLPLSPLPPSHPYPQPIELLERLYAVQTVPQKVVRKLPVGPSSLST